MISDQDASAASATPTEPAGTPARATPGGLPRDVSAEALWDIARHQRVIRMRLVGAWARGDANATAPVELIVGFQGRPSRMDVIGLQRAFEAVSGHRFVVREESSVSLADRQVLRTEARML